MQTFAIHGSTFGLIAFAMANKLAHNVKNLKTQMDDIKSDFLFL